MPVRLGDAVQQPPQRRDPLRAYRERDAFLMRGAGELPGEIAASARSATWPSSRARRGRQASARRSRSAALARGSSVPVPMDDRISILAFICKLLKKTPDPDQGLKWSG